jgi:hypothetical protein
MTTYPPREGHIDMTLASKICKKLRAAGIRYKCERCDWCPPDTGVVATDYVIWAYLNDARTGTGAVSEVATLDAADTVMAELQARLRPRIRSARETERVWTELESE